jgi:protein-disulfide isomerase
MKNTVLYFAVLIFVGVMASNCRAPLTPLIDNDAPDSAYDPLGDAGKEFDASVEDDAGPGKTCPPETIDKFNNAYSPYFGGDESIDLAVVHFSSFSCPHCAHFADDTRELWASRPDFQARVRIYFHHFIFSNETSLLMHSATVAAHNQGEEYFWAMHDRIYAGMNEGIYYSPEDMIDYAQNTLKLDMDLFMADLESLETVSFLTWDKAQGQAADVKGTPSVFVCDDKISRSQLEEIIDSYLQ